jgi:hypothetical protein
VILSSKEVEEPVESYPYGAELDGDALAVVDGICVGFRQVGLDRFCPVLSRFDPKNGLIKLDINIKPIKP